MTESRDGRCYAGGCLCGSLRYRAEGEPLHAGFCCCADCRKASGAGAIPFLGFAATAVRFAGAARQCRTPAARGTEAVRNFCPACGGLVFGGEVGRDTEHTIYAGSLDDPSLFRPTIAIFTQDRPAWVVLPEGLRMFARMP